MEQFGSELVRLMDNVQATIFWRPDSLELPEGLTDTQLTQANDNGNLDELKVNYLWYQGKTFIETFLSQIESAEIDSANTIELGWPQKLTLIFGQIVKALLRDICISDTPKEALDFIRERRNLWMVPRLTSLSEFIKGGMPEAVQLFFMQECLYYARENRTITIGIYKALRTLLHHKCVMEVNDAFESIQEQEEERWNILKELMGVISESRCLFDAINLTYDKYYGETQLPTYPKFSDIGEFKSNVSQLFDKVQLLDELGKFNAYGKSLPNFYTVICSFDGKIENLASGAIIVTFLHELSHQLQRRHIPSVSEYLNSYTPTQGCTVQALHRSLTIVPRDDIGFAQRLDGLFGVFAVNPSHEDPESGNHLEEVLFGSRLKVLFESGANFLLNADNWVSLDLQNFREGFKRENTKTVNAHRGRIDLKRSGEGDSFTFPKRKCGISVRRFSPSNCLRKAAN